MNARPRPLLGSLLGLLLGIVVVALLWQLGVAPPDRLILFGVLALTVLVVTVILTQRVALVRKRFVVIRVLCGLMAGVAVAGIPDVVAGGSLTDGCSASGTSSLDSKTPDQTSLADPFDVTRTDTVVWTGESQGVFTDWNGALGIDVGGFPIKIWSSSSANEDKERSNAGSEDVAAYLEDIEGSTGITLAGTYHVYGSLDAAEGGCDMSAYVRVEGAGAFAGALNIALWIALAVLLITILIMALVVRRSITNAVAAGGATTVVTGDPGHPGPAPLAPTDPRDAAPREQTKGEDPNYGETTETRSRGDILSDSDTPGSSSATDTDDASESDDGDRAPEGDDRPKG